VPKTSKAPSIPPFNLFRDPVWETFIKEKLAPFEQNISDYLQFWFQESGDERAAYPNQGLLLTPFDFLPVSKTMMLSPEIMLRTLRVRQYILELFNHPDRLNQLKAVQKRSFAPPPKVESLVMASCQ
jgi:hypothetical protein